MADERQQQTLMVSQDEPIAGLSQIGSLQNDLNGQNFKDVPSTDILQQALDEASNFIQSPTFSRTQTSTSTENTQHLSDHSYIHSSNSDSSIPPCEIDSNHIDQTDNSLSTEHEHAQNLHLSQRAVKSNVSVSDLNTSDILESSSSEEANKICVNGDMLSLSTTSASNCIDVFTDTSAVINDPLKTTNELSDDTSVTESPVTETFDSRFAIQCTESTASSTAIASPSFNFNNTSLKLPAKQTTAPLGSVKNPIQIIQNGDTYHSNQVLTQAQLQQISLVLQRQQAQKVLQNKSRSILYDAATNTRIVCRIVHPSELQQKTTGAVQSISQEAVLANTNANTIRSRNVSSSFRGRGRPKRPQSRKLDDDDKANLELSKEEREEKKKHRPRTRSGRISKPPSYMVKDYKRIHHLDFNDEPYDDSDGGYSDFQVSDEESEKRGSKNSSLPPGVTTAKQRNYSCSSCSKAYIGRGGLSRHYRLNPSHGKMPEGEEVSTQDENSNSSLASSVLSNSGSNTNSQTPSFSGSINQMPVQSEVTRSEVEIPPPPQYSTVTSNIIAANKRKARLKEILKSFSDEDVHEVVLPKFAQDVSLWDFFVTKCNQKSESLGIFEMLKEFEQFISQMQRESHIRLIPANLEESHGKTIINISSQQIAAALSLETGSYEVKIANTATTVPQPSINAFSTNEVTEDIPSLKRKRVESPVEEVTTRLPDQILSDAIQGENLQLPLTENLPIQSELHSQDVHSLNTTFSAENQHDIVSKALFDLSSSTIVTPSSLSSGCLSAVNASKTHPSAVLTAHSPSTLQVRKVQLFGAHQPLLPNNDISIPVTNLPVTAQCTLSNVPPTHQDPIVVPKSVEMCNNNIASSIPLDSNVDIFNSSIQELPAQTVLDSNAEPAHIVSSVAMMNAVNVPNQNVPSYTNQTVSLQTQIAQVVDKLTESHVDSLQNSTNVVNSGRQALVPCEAGINSSITVEPREFQTTHNAIPEVTKLPETSAVLRHLMLPDGQVISVWSPVENNDKVINEPFVQNYVPGNLIILQNPDGSIQVPSNQAVSAETLQTLTTMNPGLCSETGTHAFTTMQPM